MVDQGKADLSADLDNDQSNPNWRRLSPVSVAFFLGKSLMSFAKDGLPALAPLGVIILNSDNKSWAAGLGLGALGLAIVVSAVLQFWFFRYQVKPDRILISEGVFKKKQRSILVQRIQNINILQPCYFRPFTLVTVLLETAGAKGHEADLAGLDKAYADTIKAELLQQQTKTQSSQMEQQEDAVSECVATADKKRIFQYGLTSNAMFWFFAILAPVFSQIDKVIEQWIGKEAVAEAIANLGGGFQGTASLVVFVILGLLALMLLFSIAGAFLRYHGYQLRVAGETFKRSSGLINTFEESAKRPKFQAVVQQTNLLGKFMGVENLIIKQASGSQQQQPGKGSVFLVPSRTPDESERLKQTIFNHRAKKIPTQGIHRRYLFRTFAVLMVLPLLAASLLLYHSQFQLAAIIVPLALIIYLLVKRRWQHYRYGLDESFARVERGLFGYRYIEFPLFKVQRTAIKQSPLQKRRGLATIQIWLSSNRLSIPYVPIEVAREWFDRISYQIETTDKNWF